MIEGQILLTQIRNKGIPNAIIAGGYVRDHYLGGKYKDIDIFFPVTSQRNYYDRLDDIKNLDGLEIDKTPKEGYKGYKTFYTKDYLWNKIPVQFIGHKIQGEFIPSLMDSFNFNIDKMYYDGVDTIITDEAEDDAKGRWATLNQLKEMSYLPTAMKKYERLKEKYPVLKFRTTCLELIEGKKDKEVLPRMLTINEAKDWDIIF